MAPTTIAPTNRPQTVPTRVRFVAPLIGLEERRDFRLRQDRGSALYVMRAVGDPSVRFLLAEPFLICPHYEVSLADGDARELGVEHPEDALVLVTLTVRREPPGVTANLLAPLVIARDSGRGRQLVLDDRRYSLRHPLTGSR